MSVPFEIRIDAISKYFGISKDAALYIYLRKKRTWKRLDDPKYLRWCIQLQNALVKADRCIGFDWKKLQFGEENLELTKHGITIGSAKEVPMVNEKKSDWSPDKILEMQHRKTLKIMGFIDCNNPKKMLSRETRKKIRRPPVKKQTKAEPVEIGNSFGLLSLE